MQAIQSYILLKKLCIQNEILYLAIKNISKVLYLSFSLLICEKFLLSVQLFPLTHSSCLAMFSIGLCQLSVLVPFLSKYLPSDTCIIKKKGCNIRYFFQSPIFLQAIIVIFNKKFYGY